MKLNYIIIAAILFLSSCSQSNQDIPNPGSAGPISALPSVFKQKVLIEEYTEVSCGQCPKAHYYVDSLLAMWADKVYAVAIHVADPLEASTNVNIITGTNLLDSMFNTFSVYPGGSINRDITSPLDLSPDLWFSKVQSKLGQIPACGLAIDASSAVVNNHLTISVHTGFSQNLSGDYRLHGYIVEKTIASFDSTFDQLNDFSSQGSSPDTSLSFYALNDTINHYNHKYVLKKIIANAGISGDLIPQAIMAKGNVFVKDYYVDITGINLSNCIIIFFVDKYGTTSTSHLIENVQQVNVGSVKDWN